MTLTELQRFCSTPWSGKRYTQAPFVLDDWVYATDGALIVRVPAKDFATVTAPAPFSFGHQVLPMLNGSTPLAYAPLPALVPNTPCDSCLGLGHVPGKVCFDCKGKGEDIPSRTCITCCGEGTVAGGKGKTSLRAGCHECFGTGCAWAATRIGYAAYQTRLLHLIAALPCVEFAPMAADELAPARFRFDGGEGLLAAMRPEYATGNPQVSRP